MNTPAPQNNQSGAAMLGIVLVIIVILLALVGALAIGPQLQNITTERQTVKRANVIVDAVRQYYLAQGELPKPSSVPVDKLNLEQKNKFDAWGQEWFYKIETITVDGREVTDITGIEVNGQDVAGVLISGGPDQQIQINIAASETSFSSDPSNDDIIIPINVQGEAIQIAKDELGVLAGRGCPIELLGTDGESIRPVDWQDVTDGFLSHTGIGTSFRYDPWIDGSNNREYFWEPVDPSDPLDSGRWLSEGPPGAGQELRSRVVDCNGGPGDPGGDIQFGDKVEDEGQNTLAGFSEENAIESGGGNPIKVQVNQEYITLGHSANKDSHGCIWYLGSGGLFEDNCEQGICDFQDGIRAYFRFEIENRGGSTNADGFTFTVASASDPGGDNSPTEACGGPPPEYSSMGELLGYAGLGPNNLGIQPPKIGIEFDTYENKNCSGFSAANSRCDPSDDHVAVVYWVDDEEENDCEDRFCDNVHLGSLDPELNPYETDNNDEESGFIIADDLLEVDSTLEVRIEIHRPENDNDYIVKVWGPREYEDNSDWDEDMSQDFDEPGEDDYNFTKHEVDSVQFKNMDEIIFGWTFGTGGESQSVDVSDFRLSFRR